MDARRVAKKVDADLIGEHLKKAELLLEDAYE